MRRVEIRGYIFVDWKNALLLGDGSGLSVGRKMVLGRESSRRLVHKGVDLHAYLYVERLFNWHCIIFIGSTYYRPATVASTNEFKISSSEQRSQRRGEKACNPLEASSNLTMPIYIHTFLREKKHTIKHRIIKPNTSTVQSKPSPHTSIHQIM